MDASSEMHWIELFHLSSYRSLVDTSRDQVLLHKIVWPGAHLNTGMREVG